MLLIVGVDLRQLEGEPLLQRVFATADDKPGGRQETSRHPGESDVQVALQQRNGAASTLLKPDQQQIEQFSIRRPSKRAAGARHNRLALSDAPFISGVLVKPAARQFPLAAVV